MDLAEKLQATLSRMDYLLTFTLMTFVKAVIARFFDARDTMYIAVTAAVLSVPTGADRGADRREDRGADRGADKGGGEVFAGTLTLIGDCLHRLACVMAVDALMLNLRTASSEDTSRHQVFMYWITSTAAVVLIPTVLHGRLQSTVTGQQLSRLVFFMYAENSAFLIQDSEVDRVVPGLCFVLLYYLRGAAGPGQGLTVLSGIVQAACMVFTNIIISTLLQTNDVATDSDGEISWLVGLLVLFDNVQSRLPDASDLRDYAIWKSASRVRDHVLYQGTDRLTMVAGALLIAGVSSGLCDAVRAGGHTFHCQALVELAVLVAVNGVLDAVQALLHGLPHTLVWPVLLSLLCCVHVTLSRLSRAG